MGPWLRLVPFIQPYWRMLGLSFLCALATAALWSLALTVTFPVVKVFLQGQHLGSYVAKELTQTERELAELQTSLAQQQIELDSIPVGQHPSDRIRLLNDVSRTQSELKVLSARVYTFSWLNAHIVPRLPEDEFRLLMMILALVLLITLAKGLFAFLQDVLVGNVAEQAVVDLRNAMFRKLVKLDPQTVSLGGSSPVMSSFTYDVQMMSQGFSLLAGEVVREPLKACACIIAAFYVNWQLTLISLIFIPAAGLLFWTLSRRLKRAFSRVLDSMSRIFKVLEESFDGIRIVQAYRGERIQRKRFYQENKSYYQKSLKINRLDALGGPITEILGMFALLAAILPGAYLVLARQTEIFEIKLADKPIEMAHLAVLYALLVGTIDPVRKFSKYLTRIKQTSTAAERVFQLLDQSTRVPVSERVHLIGRMASEIEFRHVTFQYARPPGAETSRGPVLRELSLSLAAGDCIAVVGENGSGKSTLANLLPRFADPDDGEILWDGVSLREVPLRDLRAQIGMVTQDTVLFGGTIAENIRLGSVNATDRQVETAARAASVWDFAKTLPAGLNTQVGEAGKELSGGQRQRIALARAMLRDPSLLILDEPTAAIDAHSELLIHQALREFTRNRTTVLISHCLSPAILEFVTKVAVLHEGQLVAYGTHADLLVTCPIYTHLFRAQMHAVA